MFRNFVIAAAICLVFSPLLFADMMTGGGMGMDRQQMNRGSRQVTVSRQEKNQEDAVRVSTDSVVDILLFRDKLHLTGQQVISMQMIQADAQQESAEKSRAVQACQADFVKSLNQNTPDFAYIRAILKKLTDAEADVDVVRVNAYEKAYALLTDAQKTHLGLLRAARQQAIEQKAEENSR